MGLFRDKPSSECISCRSPAVGGSIYCSYHSYRDRRQEAERRVDERQGTGLGLTQNEKIGLGALFGSMFLF